VGLQELVARLERDADARVAAIDAEARVAIEAVERAAASAASERKAEALEGKRAARREGLQRELSLARRRASAAVLAARQAVVDRAMTRAAALLERAHEDAAYRAAASERLVRALAFVPEEGATVRCRADLAGTLRAALAGRADVGVLEDAATPPGFVVVAKDGSTTIDETLPARLARARDAAAMEIAEEAFRAR